MHDEAYDVHRLESGWNNRVSNGHLLGGGGSKFLKSASGEFLASLINKKRPIRPIRSHSLHNKLVRPEDGGDFTAFDSISAAFGFAHHPGTDKAAELKVLRQVLLREGVLLKLREACKSKSSKKRYLQSKDSTGVLDYLTQLRDITVELTEMISAWRATSISGHDVDLPRPFMWEDKNYLIKVSRDLDFISEITSLVEALGVTPDTMRCNPLMMPESLNIDKIDSPPYEWALRDAGGDSSSVLYGERLRLREAEHVILRDIAAHARGAPSISWASADGGGSLESESVVSKPQQHRHDVSRSITRERIESLSSWQRDAELQLRVLENSTGEKLNIDSITTHRLNPPELEPVVAPPKYFHSPPRLIPASPLTDLSTSIQLARSASPTSPTTNTFKGLKLRTVRGLPEPQSDGLSARGLVLMTAADIQVIAAIEHAPKSLAIAGAATMIIMAEGFEIPANVSWDAFRGRAVQTPDFADDMNGIDPTKLPQYKVRAMKPFVRRMEDEFAADSAGDPLLQASSPSSAPAKLIKWVNQVLAKTKDEPKYPRRAETAAANNNNSKKHDNAIKRSKSSTAKPSTSHLKNVKTIYSEVVEGLLSSSTPLTVSLLADKKPRANDNANMRYFVRVYDPASSREADCCIQVKNYVDLAEDLRVKCGGADISAAFDPSSEKWWIKNLKVLLVVEERSYGLKVLVSQDKIEDKVTNYHNETKKILRPKSSSAHRPPSPSSAAVSTKESTWGFQTEAPDDSPADMAAIFQQQQHHDRPISAAGDTQPTGVLAISEATAEMFCNEAPADGPDPSEKEITTEANGNVEHKEEVERQKSASLLNIAMGDAENTEEEGDNYEGDFDDASLPTPSPPPAPHVTPAEIDNDSYAADDFESAEGKEEGETAAYEDDYEEDFS